LNSAQHPDDTRLLPLDPVAVLLAWPSDQSIFALRSGVLHGWTSPSGHPLTVIGTLGHHTSTLPPPAQTSDQTSAQTSTPLARANRAGRTFSPGYVGFIEYEQGAAWEPSASAHASPLPAMTWFRCDDALIFDHADRAWSILGTPPVREVLMNLASNAPQPTFSAGPLASIEGRDAYTRAVQRGIEYIRAGDVYQVNLSHELRGPFTGNTRACFTAMTAAAAPALGAYFELTAPDNTRRAILSMSPELFLDLDGRRVQTRPMKGTRPGASNPSELDTSEKDRAELNMIIDLMRNDLGRVCEFGSLRVDARRSIEHHGGGPSGGVLQATGTVSGTLRDGVTIEDLLHATFPGGSITGAPKIRAMQIIRELERTDRGVYCGSIGYIDDTGRSQFSIAIRTAVVDGTSRDPRADHVETGTISFRVGAGIVADSDPIEEWNETLVKAAAIRAIAQVTDDQHGNNRP
jgi:para-aminobenzoate synthetase component 1